MATATKPSPKPQRQSEAWREHAKELFAKRAVLYGWRRLPKSARPGVELFAVYSEAGREHLVRYVETTGEAICDCTAALYHRPCFHAGQVLHIKEQEAYAKSESGCYATRRYHEFCDFYQLV